jgi:PKD repeat protein
LRLLTGWLSRGRLFRDRLGSIRGQSLVELAIIAPVFLLIVLMGIDFGRAFAGWETMQQSARIGANYLSTNADKYGTNKWNNTVATMRQLVRRDAAGANCSLADSDITYTVTATPVTGDPAKVSVSCKFTIITPLISAILPNPLSLNASASFPVRTIVTGITSNAPAVPVAAFSCAPTTGTAPVTITCTDLTPAQYAVTAWSWTFGDSLGGTSTDQNPTYTYGSACTGAGNTCTVSFTATNVSGTSAPATQNITVNPSVVGPTAAFTCTPSSCSGAANLFVQFTDTTTGTTPITWAWDLNGDNVTDSTIQNPSHTYTSAGSYTVKLTATNAAGSSTVTHTVTVTNGFCIVPTFTAQGGDAVSLATQPTIQTKWSTPGFTTAVLFNPSLTSSSNGKVTAQSLPKTTSQLCNSTLTLTWR